MFVPGGGDNPGTNLLKKEFYETYIYETSICFDHGNVFFVFHAG